MGSRALPGLGLQAFWALGEDGWKAGMDSNLLLLSVLVNGVVINKVAAVPGSPTNGDIYILDETNVGHPNNIAVYDNGAWVYFAPAEGWMLYDNTANKNRQFDGATWAVLVTGGGGGVSAYSVEVTDQTTAITVGNDVVFRYPGATTLTEVRASLRTASSSGVVTIDIKKNGTSILSTLLTIDQGEKTSLTAAVAAVISTAAIADDDEIQVIVTTSGVAAAGLIVTFK